MALGSLQDENDLARWVDDYLAQHGAINLQIATGDLQPERIPPRSIPESALADQEISGVVNDDGSTATGTGFTAAQIGTGLYTVTFDDEFATPPAVVVTPGGTPGVVGVTHWAPATETDFTVGLLDPSFALADGAFHFIARGT